ncbi:MAG: PAS domain-containing protein [Deltaproteobacteria bacterium]|nr:PAS domain-containing protein [Deltaproteobacteria bacterium]
MHSLARAVEALQQVADSAEDLVLLIDSALNVCYANRRVSRFLGFGSHEIIGRPIGEVFSKYGRVSDHQRLLTLFQSGAAFSLEERVALPGRELWLETHFTPIHNGTGGVRAVLGVGRDITERKQREELISRSRREWLRAIDTMPYLLAVVDDRYRFERVNKPMADRLGVTVQGAVGLTCHTLLHGAAHPPSFCPLAQRASNSGGQAAEVCEGHLGGDFQVSISPLKDPKGKVIGCLFVGREIKGVEEAAAAKKRRQEAMKVLMKSAEYMVFVQNREGKFIFFTAIPPETACPGEILGKTPYDTFDAETASRMMERVRKVQRNGRDLSQTRDLTWEGETFRIHETVSPIRDANGRVNAVVTVSKRIGTGMGMGEEPGPAANGSQSLTARESEVLELIASGLTSRQIGVRLGISTKTVETHRSKIMRKLDLHKTSALVKHAVEKGLL